MAYVFVLALVSTRFAPRLTVFSRRCYSQTARRGSSVVEQPIRNRQVVGSTPTLGSILLTCFE
jgi:hypothetical protein